MSYQTDESRDGHAGRVRNDGRRGVQAVAIDGAHRRVAAGDAIDLPGDGRVAGVGHGRGELLLRRFLHICRRREKR